ncbi:microtubule-associated protein 4 isoform X3 [Lutra lutra]|uniref:microtubule-associated protein 4 isoform X3 n=1 Tax=Lutra lutra TaxID=9657 RepID=UPI001FCF7E80|nr:microtubule-associated protein 4 isoform X3 [Lutra lutra]
MRTSPPTALRSRRYHCEVEAAGPTPIGLPQPSARPLAAFIGRSSGARGIGGGGAPPSRRPSRGRRGSGRLPAPRPTGLLGRSGSSRLLPAPPGSSRPSPISLRRSGGGQLQWCKMADLSLADALTEPPPEIEEEIKRDFIATLEAEAFDDVVGETVGKTDYIPLLDVDEKTGNSESKKKLCSDTSQVEGAPSKPAGLANGDHGIEGNETTGSPTPFLEEKMAYEGYQNIPSWPENTNFCFEPEQLVNPTQTDPFKMHHDDGLEDFLFLPSGTTNTSGFAEQNDPLQDSYGLFPCDTFAPAAVVPQGWPVEAPDSPYSESFILPEAVPQPLQPTAELAKEVEVTSAEERAPAEALEITMGLKTADMAPSRETETSPAKDMAPATETEVALAKDMEPSTKSDVTLAEDVESSIKSDTVKDMVLPRETEEAPVKGAVLSTETDVSLAKDMVLPTETEVAPAKDVLPFKETERAPPVSPLKMDVSPDEGMVPPTDKEIAPAKGVVSEVALAKDVVSSTEMSPAKEVALSPDTEVALTGDMVLPPETKVILTEDVALLRETQVAPVKDMAPHPATEKAPLKDVAPSPEPELALGKVVLSPTETEMTLGENVAVPPETEVTPVKDVPLPPETELALASDVAPPPGTEVTLANNVSPAQAAALLLETEVAQAPVKDLHAAGTWEETEESQLKSLKNEGQSAASTLIMSPEPVTAVGQKSTLPADEDSVLDKQEQKKPFGSQPSELPSETSGTPPTQGKQVYRPSDRRSTRPRPARVPPELLGGSSPRKTVDTGLGPCSLSELGWVSGPSTYGEPGNQRKTTHLDFLEPKRDLGREAWDIESPPMMMKKKKKKPKQKRYSQPRAGGPWDDDSADDRKGHPFVADPQKSGVLPSLPTPMGMEYGLASRENFRKECEVESRAAKLVAENFVSESLSVPLCPLEESLKTAGSSQRKMGIDAEVRGNKAVPLGQDQKWLQPGEGKPEPAPHLKSPVDENRTMGSSVLKGPQTEVSAHKIEIPLEIRPKEGSSPVLYQEAMGGVSKPIATKELPNPVPTLPTGTSLRISPTEANDESKVTKLQKDRQTGTEGTKEVKGTEEIKELTKEAPPKPSQETSILASKQSQDEVLVQRPRLENPPSQRTAGDGRNRKARAGSGKVRTNSGKGRARSEPPFLMDSWKDGPAVLGPSEAAPKTERMPAGGKSEELGSSKQPGTTVSLTEAVEMGDVRGPSASHMLIPLGSESGTIQTSGARTERGTSAVDRGVSNQSKEAACPWMGSEAAPWISEKPKKRGSEGKNKKFKNNYSTQPARMENKEETPNPSSVGKDRDAGSTPHPNKDLGLSSPLNHDPLSSRPSALPTVEVGERKGRNDEVNSFELGALGGNKTDIVKDAAVTEPATKVTDVSCQDQIQGAEFVPAVLSAENKTDAAKGHAAVADKPNERSNDGKSKKVKNSFPEKHLLENTIDASEIHVPMETTGDHRTEGMGYVDENRNITFTCPRTLPGLMNKLAPPEALESAAREGLPAPASQVVKEGESFPKPLAESGQETTPAQLSKLLVVDNWSRDGVPAQERPKAPSAVTPSSSTGGEVVLTLTAAVDTVNSQGGNTLKNKGELAGPLRTETGIDGGSVKGGSESVPSAASTHLIEKITEVTERHLSGMPVEDQSLQGEGRVLEACADRNNFPTHPVNRKKESEEGSAPVPIPPDLLGDKAQKPSFSEDQNADSQDSKDPDGLNKEVDRALLPSTSEKKKVEEVSLASEITESGHISVAAPEFQSDLLDGRAAATPSPAVDKLEVPLPKDPELPEPKDKISEAPDKMTEKSERKAPGEGNKEDKSRVAEPLKGYMRPTKSRGLTPLLPKSTVQERERARQLKSGGISKPEEGRPAGSVTGNDITAPPNKELPPSPEKKTKPLATTQPAKTSTSKAKTQPTPLPKQSAPTTFGGSNKKPMSLAAGLVPAAPPKRPAAATARPSTLPAKDAKPKQPAAEAKVPEKRTSPSKLASAPALKPGSKSTQTVPKASAAASPASAGPSSRSPPTPVPRRPTAIKTEGKPADMKKTATQSAPADLSRSKSTSTSSVKKSTTVPGAAPVAGVAPSRAKPTPTPPRPSGTPSSDKKPTSAKPSSSAPRLSRPSTNASAPDLKNVRSKVGSTENIKHQPGGGRAKVEKKTEASAPARKPEPNAVAKTAGPIASVQKPPAGKVQIVSKKVSYSHIQSKCGSKDNIKHVPGGGNVQIQNKKVDISKVSSKCGSKANIKHKPGGGDVKIESQKLNFKEKAQAKVGSLDNVGHLPAGGAVKTEGGGSEAPPCPGPPAGEEPAIPEPAPEAGAPTSASGLSGHTTLAGGGDQREAQTLDSQIQETN